MPNLNLVKIAQMAGVSRSTVSRVVNNHPNVSDDVRERVLQIIQETGYRPNLFARSLRVQYSNIVGLVLSKKIESLFSDPYFPVITQGVMEACNDYQKTLALFIEDEDEELIKRITKEGLLDGFIFQMGKINQNLGVQLQQSNIPFVLLGRPAFDGTTYIDVNNVLGAQKAVKHFQNLGYQRIATITGDVESTVGIDRLNGYRQAMLDGGYPLDETLIVDGGFDETMAYQAALTLIDRKADAIFVTSDLMARSAIRAIMDKGLRVPEDIAIIGYDDLVPAVSAYPMITTIHQPVREFGYRAVEILLDRINNEALEPQEVIMDVELIIRDTCGAKLRS